MYFLENKKIGLRALREEDTEHGYRDWFNDSVVCRYNSHHRYVMTAAQLRAYVQRLQEDRSCLVLAIEDRASQVHVGNIALQQINLIDRQAEIAFILGEKEYWNKGYATQAAALLIDHAFYSLGLHRIYFGTAQNNTGMQRVGEKLHFQKSGVRRQAFYKNGRYWDLYDYDLLREDWEQATGKEDGTDHENALL